MLYLGTPNRHLPPLNSSPTIFIVMRNVLFTTCLLIAACATPYQEKGYRGGYSDFEVEPGLYYSAFEGNRYISSVEAKKYWHQRAKEICGKYEMVSQDTIIKSDTRIHPEMGGYTTHSPTIDGYVRCIK